MSLLSARASPWQIANIPGPKMAMCPDNPPKVFAPLIKRAKNPLLIVGGLLYEVKLGDKTLVDYSIEIASRVKCPLVATAHTIKLFLSRGFQAIDMSLVDIVNRLQDPKFTVDLGRAPPHDLVVFLGIRYELASQGLSTLKNFALHLRTVTLCRWYHPNATYSFPNVKDEEWKKLLDELLQALG